MKRKIVLFMLVFALAAMMVSAQGWGPGWNNRVQPETVTVSGSLVVAQGRPALKSGDVTYFVSGINRLVGFVEGLKEGAQITVEGIALGNPYDSNFKVLRSSKLTLNGKTYELETPGQYGFMGHGGERFAMGGSRRGGGGYGMGPRGGCGGYGHSSGGRW